MNLSARRKWSVMAAGPAVLLLFSSSGPAPRAQIVRAEDAIVAMFGLQTSVEVEKRILKREETHYDENLHQRADLNSRLNSAYAELEKLFAQERAEPDGEETSDEERMSPEQLSQAADAKEIEVRDLEKALSGARDEARTIRDEIRRIKARIAMLDDKIAELRHSLPQDRDSVTGIWDISLMPSGDKGVFALWQSGTLVSGQYVLDGPFRGSLEGTLINRQLLVRRIDATLGRSMEFSGYLSDDGMSVHGTWLNYNLSSGARPTGSWSGKKRSSSPSDVPPSLPSQEPQ